MNEELVGLDLIALLDRLEPVPEPTLISLWPQTAAWIWIALALIAIAAWLGRRVLLSRRANSYRRAAIREIASAAESPEKLAEILRRTALVAFPRTDVAGLYGDAWLAFLDRTGHLSSGAEGQEFRQGAGRAFAEAPYANSAARDALNASELASLAARWVRSHRPLAEEGES